jgi:transcriptional regulator with XRE-family HTH domain
MSFHIGKLINDQLKKVGMTKSEFARRVTSSPQTIHYILKRKSIDTALLQKISKTLNYDFFQHYLGLSKQQKENNHLLGFTANDIKHELQAIKTEIEIVSRHNSYLKEIVELIKPEHLNEKIKSKSIKSINPNLKTKPNQKPQTNKNSAKKVR